jgi:hypothetical protein
MKRETRNAHFFHSFGEIQFLTSGTWCVTGITAAGKKYQICNKLLYRLVLLLVAET